MSSCQRFGIGEGGARPRYVGVGVGVVVVVGGGGGPAGAGLLLAARGAGLLDALLASVDQARYWQPPDDADQLLADPGSVALLTPRVRSTGTGVAAA